ncbi:hypothetical protein DL96DRAFT_507616 [Flagelloscypha sp. PMI_526]|nr:hypothetical protein DL96DRAFT_507616 [Flagelloscypha sp. PMI_526]
MSGKDAEIDELLKLRTKCKNFRILVIGRANAGKITICQRMCNTTGLPIVQDAKGNMIDVTPSTKRGVHDINAEIVYPKNAGFIFHDSCGMESGLAVEKDIVMNFIRARGKTMDLRDQLHAIWQCLQQTCSPVLRQWLGCVFPWTIPDLYLRVRGFFLWKRDHTAFL